MYENFIFQIDESLILIGIAGGIIGMVVSILALFITILIRGDTKKIKKNQIDNAQIPYKLKTNENLNEIHGYFRDILRVTKDYDVEELENGKSEDLLLINTEFNNFFKINKLKMSELIKMSDMDLRNWVDLDKNVRAEFQIILTNFKWLQKKFFLPDRSESVQIRIWKEQQPEVLEKKLQLEKTLSKYDYILKSTK